MDIKTNVYLICFLKIKLLRDICVIDSNNICVTSYAKSLPWNRERIVTIKYNGLGDTLWTSHFTGNSNAMNCSPYNMMKDDQGNLYISGEDQKLISYSTDLLLLLKLNTLRDTLVKVHLWGRPSK